VRVLANGYEKKRCICIAFSFSTNQLEAVSKISQAQAFLRWLLHALQLAFWGLLNRKSVPEPALDGGLIEMTIRDRPFAEVSTYRQGQSVPSAEPLRALTGTGAKYPESAVAREKWPG
jgi:hypothetical protein